MKKSSAMPGSLTNGNRNFFPREEYAYRNGCCFAFAHLLAEKAKAEGMMPLKVWSLPQAGKRLEAQFATDNGLGTGKREWEGYHVALALDLPVYKDSKRPSVWSLIR